MTTVTELARLIDHALLHPTLTDAELRDECALAAHYGVASVCIKPYAVPAAATWLAGTGGAGRHGDRVPARKPHHR
jgi:deoxyribose-phosphate aldolase